MNAVRIKCDDKMKFVVQSFNFDRWEFQFDAAVRRLQFV